MDDLSDPLPVAVLCELLGVPEADEAQFNAWATHLATALELDARHDEAGRREITATFDAISGYMRRLIAERRRHPADDMLSGLAARGDRRSPAMGAIDLISTAILLLIAGHETTVNLITNGMLNPALASSGTREAEGRPAAVPAGCVPPWLREPWHRHRGD